jgi:hypothetical protein
MAIQWTGVLSGARDLLLDGETVSITVEDNRTIHLPRSLFIQAAGASGPRTPFLERNGGLEALASKWARAIARLGASGAVPRGRPKARTTAPLGPRP